MKINILFTNESSQNPFEIFAATKKFFKEYNHEINFYERNENHGYHAHLLIKDNLYVSGGARIQEKKDGWYQLIYYMGKLRYAPTLDSILTHEILHLFFQEFGLGDIHKHGSKLGQWYNREAMNYWIKNAKLRDNKPDKSIVHHNAVKRFILPRYTIDRNYHLSLGWCDLGYHFYIEASGELKIGRWLAKRGAHCLNGENWRSAGICMAGNFNIERPTKKQIETLKKLLIELGFKTIGPHRRWQPKDCYGSKLSDDWAEKLIMKKLTRAEVILLYELIFHRPVDSSAFSYIGHDLEFVLNEFKKSKEWDSDDELITLIKNNYNLK